MASDSSEGVSKQLQRLFNQGAVGTLTDAQLLEWFVSRRDDAAAAAFEELVIRHGPLVLDVCRRVLHDSHDAEDAFQATFLVLADRASSIIRRASVGSWLFGVAQRVASRARARAARQRFSERTLAEHTPKGYVPDPVDLDRDILDEELARLSERLRAPIVLCYLQGLTYLEAARQLKVSDGVLRGRLERARKRLQHRLTRRGVTIPAGLFAAAVAGSMQAQASVSTALVHSTVRIAQGFVTCESATLLARGVLSSMLKNQLKFVTALAVVCAVGSLGLWQAFATVLQDRAQTPAKSAAPKKSAPQAASTKPQAPTTGPPYQLRGIVRVEGTHEPVAGSKFRIMLGEAGAGALPNERVVATGVDGRFAVELMPGNVRLFLSELPAGYWAPNDKKFMESLAFGPAQPLIDREYNVRKGTIWTLRFSRGAESRPHAGTIIGSNPSGLFIAHADNKGLARLTLPAEGGKVALQAREGEPMAPANTGFLTLNLEWDANFRPDELEKVVRLDGNERRFRLTDVDANSATLHSPDSIEPVNENGRLLIRVVLPEQRAQDVLAIAGQVIDTDGRPIPGARVSLGMGGARAALTNPWHQATTDARGGFRLREVPRSTIDGKPSRVTLIVAKEGFIGIVSRPLNLTVGDTLKPQSIQPIRLDRGVSLSGVVVDHRGKPAAGAWVRANYLVRLGQLGASQSVKADANGRFTFHDVPRNMIQLMADYGELYKGIMFLADGSRDEARIQLPAKPREFPAGIGALRAAPPDPPALGRPAPELEVGPWSDHRSHTLASERGKVVVLYFCGLSFDPSIRVLPAVGRLAKEYGPRGAVFLAVYNAEREPEEIREQLRKVLAFKGAEVPFAVDQMRVKFHARGVTADRYGQKMAPPFVVIVDREGKIAFHSESATGDANVNSLVRQAATDSAGTSEEQVIERVERALRKEIERVLK